MDFCGAFDKTYRPSSSYDMISIVTAFKLKFFFSPFVSVSVQMVFGSSTALSAYVFQIECGRYHNVTSPGIFSSPTNICRDDDMAWHGKPKEHLINETHFFFRLAQWLWNHSKRNATDDRWYLPKRIIVFSRIGIVSFCVMKYEVRIGEIWIFYATQNN